MSSVNREWKIRRVGETIKIVKKTLIFPPFPPVSKKEILRLEKGEKNARL